MFSCLKIGLAMGLLFITAGCAVVTSEKFSNDTRKKERVFVENEGLMMLVAKNKEWRRMLVKFEDGINRLESIVEPLAPLKEKNMELMERNSLEGEEAGGGSLSEIFYLVQTAYSELDLQAANLANDITNSFDRDDFVQTYLFNRLENKVFTLTLEVAEIVLRRSTHMATDRRLTTARLKSLNECFMSLRNLSENQAFDLSYRQHKELLIKIDYVRIEYGKTLKTDYFPAIPHFVPLASGEDYLSRLDKMNGLITEASVFYNNPNDKKSRVVAKSLDSDLNRKKELLKTGVAK